MRLAKKGSGYGENRDKNVDSERSRCYYVHTLSSTIVMHTTYSTDKKQKIRGYHEIASDIRSKISSGELAPGAMLPSRRDLARMYAVAPVTIARAIGSLVEAGAVRADHGRGTFVADGQQATAPLASDHRPSSLLRASNVFRPAAPKSTRIAVECESFGVVTNGEVCHSLRTLDGEVNERIIVGFEQAILEAGHTCRWPGSMPSGSDYKSIRAIANEFIDSGVRGIVVIDHRLSNDDIEQLQGLDVPVVVVSEVERRMPLPVVFDDNRDAGQIAARHLLDMGCRSMLFFSSGDYDWVTDRLQGAHDILDGANVPLQECVSTKIRNQPPDWYGVAAPLARECLAQGSLPDGVIAANDYMAAAFKKIAFEAGLIAGRDYSLIGFDDIIKFRGESLTSLRPPYYDMGREAARVLLGTLAGQSAPARVCLRWEMIVRESSEFMPRVGGLASARRNLKV